MFIGDAAVASGPWPARALPKRRAEPRSEAARDANAELACSSSSHAARAPTAAARHRPTCRSGAIRQNRSRGTARLHRDWLGGEHGFAPRERRGQVGPARDRFRRVRGSSSSRTRPAGEVDSRPAGQTSRLQPRGLKIRAVARRGPVLPDVVLLGHAITTKGQVTIPQEIREELGLLPNTEVTSISSMVRPGSARHATAAANCRAATA